MYYVDHECKRFTVIKLLKDFVLDEVRKMYVKKFLNNYIL